MRLELEALDVSEGAGPESTESEVVQQIDIPETLGDWRIFGSEVRLGRSSESGTSKTDLILLGPKPARIQIPGEFRAGDFDQVLVTMRAESRPTIKARFLSGREELSVSPVLDMPRMQVVTVEIPAQLPAGVTADRMELFVAPIRNPVRIYGIALVKAPREAMLPTAELGPQLFDMAGQTRRAYGVSTRAPLSRRFSVPKDGVVSFDYGWPRAVQDDSAESALIVRVLGEDTVLSAQRIKLVPSEFPTWEHVELPLGEWAGRDVALQVGVKARLSAAREFAVVVTQPILFVPDPRPPTVLLVTSDTHRFDHMGKAGAGVDVATPALDALAARGVFFDNCLTATNVTLPSHVALLTGASLRETGVLQNNQPVADAAPTLAERFAAEGYATLAVVAVEHLGHPESNLGQGFDRMIWPRGSFDAAQVVSRVLTWTEDYEGRPLFVWAHLFDAHSPYSPPDPSFVQRYYTGDPRASTLPDPEFPQPPSDAGIRDIDYVHALYRGEVSYLDSELGRLFDAPRFRDGIIAFTADHGESLGAHGIWWTHSGLYPDTLHVPLVITWPGAPAGERVSQPVRQIEVGRTLLDLAGLNDAVFPGRSLAELAGTHDTPRFSISANAADAAVSLGSFHCVLVLKSDSTRQTQQHAVELYDLSQDPGCLVDVSRQDPERTRALRNLLIEWLIQAPDTNWAGKATNLSADRLEALAELGYVIDAAGAASEFFDSDCTCEFCAEYRPEN